MHCYLSKSNCECGKCLDCMLFDLWLELAMITIKINPGMKTLQEKSGLCKS